MSKIHITLVGGQPVPNYLGIKHVNPDIVYYIYSSKTIHTAYKLRDFFPSIEHKFCSFNPVNLNDVEQRVTKLLNEVKPGENEVSINLVGGTKTWTIEFYEKFRSSNAALMLIDQNNIVWDLRTKSCVEDTIDMDTIFRLYQKVPECVQFNTYDDQDRKVAKSLEDLWIDCSTDAGQNSLTLLTTDLNQGAEIHWKDGTVPFKKSKISSFKNGQKSGWWETDTGNKMEVHSPGFVSLTINDKTYDFQSKHAFNLVTNTGWFEYKVADMLSRWSHAQNVICNAVIVSEGNKKDSLNEIDVIVFTGKKLLFVECKTRLSKPTDIDKFANDVRRYGGLASKSLFITYSQISSTCQEKMNVNKIAHYQITQHEDCENNLFKLLDRMLDEINEV